MANYLVTQLDAVPPVPCPCGEARRGFLVPGNPALTLHLTDITEHSQVHYHKRLTEAYFVLEGTGYMELDGERVPLRPFTSVLIKPGCRHRAVPAGRLRVVIAVTPAFDPADEYPADEWIDEAAGPAGEGVSEEEHAR